MQTLRAGGRFLVLTLGLCWAFNAIGATNHNITVHEWGTFTSFQDEQGKAIGGINTDDEPVPKFVHRIANLLLIPPTEVPRTFFQGAPRCHSDVTMRLETPVLYFYAPPSQTAVPVVDVNVGFRGGWLTEFYPKAEVVAPGVTTSGHQSRFGSIERNKLGTLTWDDLKIGGDWSGPETSEHVWLAPRKVKAVPVRATNGESEKYVFYRGVGNVDAPLRVSRENGQLMVRSQLPRELRRSSSLKVPFICLVDIRRGGRAAFRVLPAVEFSENTSKVLTTTPAQFRSEDFADDNLEKMKAALRSALITDGLYADEADALLNTWALSYFKSPGLRLFFLLPVAWTDHVLPLEISGSPTIGRVMVGRIELVTPEQRRLLERLSAVTPEQIKADAQVLGKQFYDEALRAGANAGRNPGVSRLNQVMTGDTSLAEYGVKVPETYQMYLDLGRFRNALVLHAEKTSKEKSLKTFIEQNALDAYVP